MITELRAKSQVTIPKELVKKLGLTKGDKLSFFEQDGMICILPVVIYPKNYINDLRNELEVTKAKIAAGNHSVFDSVDALFTKLEEH